MAEAANTLPFKGERVKRKETPKDKAVTVAKKIAKTRDGYICQKCGKSKSQGWQIHGAHIMPVGWSGTAANPRNIIALCAACHSMGKESSHDNPVQFGRWFDKKYPGLYDEMQEIAVKYSQNPFPKIDWIELKKELDEELKKLLTEKC